MRAVSLNRPITGTAAPDLRLQAHARKCEDISLVPGYCDVSGYFRGAAVGVTVGQRAPDKPMWVLLRAAVARKTRTVPAHHVAEGFRRVILSRCRF